MSSSSARGAALPALALSAVALLLYLFLSPASASVALPHPRALFSRPASSSSPLTWYDYERITSKTRTDKQVIAPLHLRHLDEFRAPAPFNYIHVVSAWLDSRPLLAARAPDVTILATMQGQPYMTVPESTFKSNPVHCYLIVKHRESGVEEVMVTPSVLVGLRDSHSYDKDLVTVLFTCPLEDEQGESLEWRDADIFVTLSLPTLPPPADVFLPVTPLPVLDPAKHVSGQGRGAVCLPPLSTDLYAPVMRDFIQYYRGLGFNQFYAYLLDPGPETLDVIRQLALEDPGFLPIRWGLPKTWMKSGTYLQSPSRDFRVEPSDWKVPGVEELAPDVEFNLGVSTDNERDVRIWYFGQHPAQQDCAYRAMADGIRFVANVDYDEYLSFMPAKQQSWPSPTSLSESPMSGFVDWARSLQPAWDGSRPLGEKGVPIAIEHSLAEELRLDVWEITKGMLPSGFVFQSSFMCVKCRPSDPPPADAVAAVTSRFPSLDWRTPGLGGVPLAFSSPVRMDWLPIPVRSKAVIDPWAWHSGVIHYPGVPYVTWALQHGFCSSSAGESSRSSSDSECATALLLALGSGSIPVRPSPATAPGSTWQPLDSGRGALYHVRVNKDISVDNIELMRLGNGGARQDVVSGEKASELFRSHRVEKDQWLAAYRILLYSSTAEVELYEDWSLATLMAGTLLENLEEKTRRAGAGGAGWGWIIAVGSFVAVGVWVAGRRKGQQGVGL